MKLRAKIIFTFSVFCVLFFLVAMKAFYVQVLNRDKLLAYARGQFIRTSRVYPNRGIIYDRNLDPLAINIQTYSIFTIPKMHKGSTKKYEQLAAIIPELNIGEIKKKVSNRNKYTWLARKIRLTKEQLLRINTIEGIFVEPEPSRYYPNHELMAQVLGFVGLDNIGLSGIEYEYDAKLRGEEKIIKYLKDAKGRPVKYETSFPENKTTDIVLTLDKDIQSAAEKFLREAMEKHRASKGGIGIMDAHSGEILAMANYPSFDPNNLSEGDIPYRKLAFTSDPFEPGSVFKILTVASALENKLIRPDTNFYCEQGKLQVLNHFINESDSTKKYEWLSVSDIIAYSSNIGTTKIAFDLTFPKLKATLEKFNVGKKTGIENPGESRGIFTAGENVDPLSLSNISFGQGVATTGIQMLAAYSAIANGGIYTQPTMVKNSKKESYRVLSEEVVEQLKGMLIQAVEKGTGPNAKIPNFVIAGKTGTAQKAIKGGGYKSYIPAFIGFPINIEKPFVVYVYIEDPSTGLYYGNEVAAPVFKKITQYILYKNREIKSLIGGANEEQKSVDEIKVRQAAPRSFGPGKIPSFIGLDKLSAERLAKSMGMVINHSGLGLVISQFPDKGGPIRPNQTVELKYEPPRIE